MKNEEKKFLKPEAEIIDFVNEDIITDSEDMEDVNYPGGIL